MSLEIRKKNIEKISKRFRCNKITDLFLEIKLPENLAKNLAIAAMKYIANSIDYQNTILNEKKLLKKLIAKRKNMKNITPNGIIVPKREISLDFNFLVKSYVDVIKFLDIMLLKVVKE